MPIRRIGTDFTVNTTATGNQQNPSIIGLADGRLLVTWESFDGADGFGAGIRGRLYTSDGVALGADFIVNTTGALAQTQPAAVALSTGGFVVTWLSGDGGDGDGSCIRARFYGPTGPIGDDFVVNSTAEGSPSTPSLTALSGGRIVATWSSNDGGDGSETCIRGRIFESNGTPVATDFVINSTADRSQYLPTVTTLQDGRFVVSWFSTEITDADSDGCVRARIFSANGTPAGPDFIVNSTTAALQSVPSIAAFPDGRLIATYESRDDGFNLGGTLIRARVFGSDGLPSGPDFIVNSSVAASRSDPSIAVLADGRVLVTWVGVAPGDGSGNAIFGRILRNDGLPLDDEFIVNSTTIDFQYAPTISALADGRFAVSWHSTDPGDGSGSNIRSQIFDPRVFRGTAGDNFWTGGSLADRIEGDGGADILSGGAGNDVISGGDGNDFLFGDAGNDLLFGDAGDDLIQGLDGNDAIEGNEGADTLLGQDGNDIITGGVGNDGIDGGAGTDAALFFSARANYYVRSFVSGGQFFTQVTAAFGSDGVDNLVNIEVLGFNSGAQAFGLAGIQQNLVSNIDGSIYDDVLFQNSSTGQIIYQNMTAGAAAGFGNVLGSLPAGWRLVGSDDFSGDGRADGLVQDTNTGTIYTLNIASGAPVWGVVAGALGASYQAIASGDVTLDGTADVLVRNNATGETFIADMNAGGVFGGWLAGPNLGTGWRTVGLGDFNRDGASDVLVQSIADGTTYYRDIANGQWGTVAGPAGAQWVARESADLNGDGYADVVFQNSSTGDIWWVNMLGGTNAGWNVVANGLIGWEVRGSADVDNDGWRDVIIQNTSNGTTYYADMNNGVFGGFGAVSGALGTQWLAVG